MSTGNAHTDKQKSKDRKRERHRDKYDKHDQRDKHGKKYDKYDKKDEKRKHKDNDSNNDKKKQHSHKRKKIEYEKADYSKKDKYIASDLSLAEDGGNPRIYVSGLNPQKATVENVAQLFGQIGRIKTDKRNYDEPKIKFYFNDKHEKSGDCTITYDDCHTAPFAIEWFNNTEFLGNTIKVEMAQPPKTKEQYLAEKRNGGYGSGRGRGRGRGRGGGFRGRDRGGYRGDGGRGRGGGYNRGYGGARGGYNDRNYNNQTRQRSRSRSRSRERSRYHK